jgi:hypothetical protein
MGMSNEIVLVLSKDEELIVWLREFLPHMTVLNEDTKTKYQSYMLSIFDATTLSTSERLLDHLKIESHYLIFVITDFSALDEKTLALCTDVWEKPLFKPVAEKRLKLLIESHVFGMFGINSMSFEIKNPLASIKGYADVLLSGMTGNLSEQQRSFITIMSQNASGIVRKLDNYRDFQGILLNNFDIERELIYANELEEAISQSQKHLDVLLSKKIEIQIPDNLPQIYADKWRLVQAISNLFTIDSKRIILSIKSNGTELLFCLETDAVVVFRQELPNFGGTWEKDRITEHIIEAHGGRLWFESEVGKGTTFYFTLPIGKDETPE